MKNLTHYFKSPKEDETDNKGEISESPIEIVVEKACTKKRKLSLSKSKKMKSESQKEKKLSPENSNNKCEAQNKPEEPPTEKLPGKTNKKRKIEGDSNSSYKKIKTSKSLKISLKTCENKRKVSSDINNQTTKPENNQRPTQSITPETEDKGPIFIENSLSCDEPLIKTKRRSKKNLFDDSDNETVPLEIESPSTGKAENSENSSNTTSRKSLFSYFNKVDKETAFKQQKPGKIEVKAIVHSSPSGAPIRKQTFDKLNLPNKAKKHKNKLKHDDSDSIEVISSEELIDENSSNNVNVPFEAEQVHKVSSDPNVENTLNKSKPSNLASIFMPKKIGQHTTTVEDSPRAEKEIVAVKGDEKVQCKEETKQKKPRQALSKSKKSQKRSQSLNHDNKEAVDNENDAYLEKESQQVERQVVLVNGTVNKSSNKQKNFSGKLNSHCSEKSPEEKTIIAGEIPKFIKSFKNLNNSESKAPEKSNVLKLKCTNDEEITPKKKGPTINGYFTPKNNKLTSNNTSSSEKCTSNTKSPWVMKVCLNSTSKSSRADSDEEVDEDSQDSVKDKQKETPSNSQDKSDDKIENNEVSSPVEVIDVDDDSSAELIKDNQEGKRRSLPRNAKKPNPDIKEEEDTIEVKPQTPKPAVKMWPFFQKGGTRQTKEAPVDEAKLKAKMLFLESGVPEIIKRKVETVKSDAVLGSPAPFPTVSHVLQTDAKTIDEGADAVSLRLPLARSVSPPPAVPAWTSLLPLESHEEPEIPVFERSGNVKAFLEKLKEEEPKTEVKVLYKKLKEYKSKAESDIWTEVYKPTSSADMVGNSENIKKLKTWLETLKNCRKREGSVSSGEEFVNEDSDGEENSFNNMAVICGPCGCGKTSAVYAIAKELDIKVLEINASCNRSGKRILAEFSESTQSHHVERSQPINGFFNNQGSGKKKRKKYKISDRSKSEKTSLILVEDADLLFTDCDEGFVPALASLAVSSKRPIVLVTNQATTPHLDRFNNSKLLRLKFNRPRPSKLGLWLRLIGLVEGVTMPSELALHLVTVSNCDVRRCLLQMQLMVHSNNSEVKDKLNTSRLWWGWPSKHQLNYELPTLLEPEQEELRPDVDKKVVLSQLQSLANTTRRLALLDMLSPSSRTERLEEHEDPCPVAWAARWRDSTALTVPSTYDLGLAPEAAWLQQALATSHDCGLSHRMGQTPQEARWLSILRQGEQFFMSGVSTTAHTSHQSVTCDYLPSLRELGRAEQVRLANYTRRANRFFNYLQGLGIHASKSYRDFMCDAFS